MSRALSAWGVLLQRPLGVTVLRSKNLYMLSLPPGPCKRWSRATLHLSTSSSLARSGGPCSTRSWAAPSPSPQRAQLLVLLAIGPKFCNAYWAHVVDGVFLLLLLLVLVVVALMVFLLVLHSCLCSGFFPGSCSV